MNRINKLLLGLLLAVGSIWAQSSQVSSIRILTEPQGARFYVDGVEFSSAQVFLWPTGSKHIVQFPLFQAPDGASQPFQVSLDQNIHWNFQGWKDSAGLLASTAAEQTITANSAITELKATLTPAYRVTVRFSEAPTAPPSCGGAPGDPPQDGARAGLVYIGNTCYGSNQDLYLPLGQLPLNAFPYPGWVFVGWSINGYTPNPYLVQYAVTGPTTLVAMFAQGKRVKFVTDPMGLKVLVDRSPINTSSITLTDKTIPFAQAAYDACQPDYLTLPPAAPKTMTPLCYGEFDFMPGSNHVIGAPTPQLDAGGKYWILDSFSNGMGPNSVYTANTNTSTKDLMIAKFVPGIRSSIISNPGGMKIAVDGRDNWGTYNFVWAAGSKHQLSAPATQSYNGRKYVFKSWSNGGKSDQEITIDPAATDYSVTAIFEVLPQAILKSNPSGITLTIDGQPCKTPCVLDRAKGSTAVVAAAARVPLTDVQRWDLTGWSDSGSASRTITFTADSQTLTANYLASYRLALVADPAGSANFQVTPPSSDNFYMAGTSLSVTAAAKPGFKFRRFDGDLIGTSSTASLSMLGFASAVAYFEKVPFIPAAGIKNAAGETPETALAPNSVIAIYGENLAGDFEIGNSNPLSQTIGNVIVMLKPGDRILPLLFVSASQINAILPSVLPDGKYTLHVQWNGQDVAGDFQVARDAPGLFTTAVGTDLFVVATHADGSLVNRDSPASAGENINVYGTGFGPYDKPVVDGFTIPGLITYKVVDPVEATLGDQKLTVVSSQAASDMAGTTVTRITLPSNAASGSPSLTFKVNGKSSNSVLVPIR